MHSQGLAAPGEAKSRLARQRPLGLQSAIGFSSFRAQMLSEGVLLQACLAEIPASSGRVQDRQLQAFVWADDESRPRCEGNALLVSLIRIQHPIPTHVSSI